MDSVDSAKKTAETISFDQKEDSNLDQIPKRSGREDGGKTENTKNGRIIISDGTTTVVKDPTINANEDSVLEEGSEGLKCLKESFNSEKIC
ncbi:hypothetical protein CWI37_2223p0010 [Hamiltosporidium tvaerminnensis]|uniref:Uncharacterized protein n=1 Tax=Hamiltosporidium tvaerminnensis TaxID=1176355 RepID=A0A4Q9KS80_9MICR|nr:hypothetical protein CWI37_2223p0010 [Hamiltosporidium tvaerminnensis]